jgi:hypothetical protein
MNPFVISDFRDAFPEFQDIAKYPDAMLTFWSNLAYAQVNCNRWGQQTLMGIQLYTAHEITLASQNYKAGNIGGVPGGASGPINTKTVGSVTASYDTQQTAEKDAGYWNLTIYGKQFIRLARMFGAGAVQL